MKYGFFSDIHSNYDAFLEVLKFFEKEKVKKFICVGDIIGYGAEPDECVKKVKELNAICVCGNHDYALKDQEYLQYFNDAAYFAIKWHLKNIRQETKDFIFSLSLSKKEKIFDIYHGSAFEPENFHYILSDFDYLKNLKYFDNKILIIGHTHMPEVFCFNERNNKYGFIKNEIFEIEKDSRYIINVGSVGQPRDGDPRACCCIFDEDNNLFLIKRLEYDIKSAMKKILDANLPEILAYRLVNGR